MITFVPRSAPALLASVIALGIGAAVAVGAAGVASAAQGPIRATAGRSGSTARMSPELRPQAELNFVPVLDCRVLDTRVDGGLLKDHARSFRVTGTGSLAAQGGSKAGCGIPTMATAVFATIISIDQSGSGTLRATAFGSPMTRNPILVFHRSSVSTTVLLPLGSPASDTNITVHAYGAATQILVDVTGYLDTDLT
jgi:hypothetical protein